MYVEYRRQTGGSIRYFIISRFQLHEFTNSLFQLHELLISASRNRDVCMIYAQVLQKLHSYCTCICTGTAQVLQAHRRLQKYIYATIMALASSIINKHIINNVLHVFIEREGKLIQSVLLLDSCITGT